LIVTAVTKGYGGRLPALPTVAPADGQKRVGVVR